jgi:hypothetical protein
MASRSRPSGADSPSAAALLMARMSIALDAMQEPHFPPNEVIDGDLAHAIHAIEASADSVETAVVTAGPSVDDLSPPFPRAAGRWVPLLSFTAADKSFGVFWCPTCDKRWFSAHAHRVSPNQQQCTQCKTYRSPVFMWENAPRSADYDSEGSSEGSSDEYSERIERPHLAHLCQRCQSGRPCTNA